MTQTAIIWTLIAAAVIAVFVIRAVEKTRLAKKYFTQAQHGARVTSTGDAGIDEIFQPVNRCENNRTQQLSQTKRTTVAA